MDWASSERTFTIPNQSKDIGPKLLDLNQGPSLILNRGLAMGLKATHGLGFSE